MCEREKSHNLVLMQTNDRIAKRHPYIRTYMCVCLCMYVFVRIRFWDFSRDSNDAFQVFYRIRIDVFYEFSAKMKNHSMILQPHVLYTL